jgi:hypothetical protein
MRALTALGAMLVLCGCGGGADEVPAVEELAAVPAASGVLAGAGSGTITNIEPNDTYADISTIDDVFFARIAPKRRGDPYGWWSRIDLRYDNDTAQPQTIDAVRLDTNVTAAEDHALAAPLLVAAGTAARIKVPDGPLTRLSETYPTTLKVDLLPLGVSRTVSFRRSDAPTSSGGFRFPAKASDLAPGQYWYADRHAFGADQAYAYDLKVVRWTGSGWTSLKPGGSSAVNADHLAFGVPLYAATDGYIVRCSRTELDDGNGSGGNSITMDIGNGEYLSYWHMKEDSVTTDHCPHEGFGGPDDDDPAPLHIFVRAGTQIGEVGNSGNSSGPHTHLQRSDTLTAGPDANKLRSLPLAFYDIDVRSRAGDDATDPDTFTRIPFEKPAALHVDADADSYLVAPNPCGWAQYNESASEVTHHGVSAACFDSITDAVVDAGFRPVWVDGYDVAGKTYFNAIWRQDDGVAWGARHGLTSAAYQDLAEDMLDAGLQIAQVDSYLEGGAVRYAAIFRAGMPTRAAYHAQTTAQHQQRVDTWPALGYHPVAVSVVSVNGARQYTAVWEQSAFPSWVLDSNIPSASLSTTIGTQQAAGRKVWSLQGYRHGGALYFAAVFGSSGPTSFTSGQNTSAQHQATMELHRSVGRDTRAVTGFESGGVARFVGVWAD